MIKIRGLNVDAIKATEKTAKKIAEGRKWTKRDWDEDMNYSDALELPDSFLEYISPTNAYKLLKLLDKELWKYGLCIRSKDGEPLLYTSEEEFDINAFVSDGWLYLGLEKYIL